ncbi:MAG: hypothetical protein ACYCYO_07270 [Bacilli bacterium]
MIDTMRQQMGCGCNMGQGNEQRGAAENGGMNHRMKQRMGMMKQMTGQGGGQKSMDEMGGMMRMCRTMTDSVAKSADMAGFATDEIRGLFQDWLNQVEAEVLAYLSENGGQIDVAGIAGRLSISEKSARHIVGSLFQRGALDLGQVHATTSPVQETPGQGDASSEKAEATDTKDE